ncbi:protein Red [Podospora conica]|nr:protein Red [Schizothecium conicum]
MNNDQFRRLLLANSNAPKPNSNGASTPSTSRTPGGALGSKLKSSIPMTPRSVTGVDFARQLAEKNKEASGSRPPKKMRTAAPKGSKLAEGYVDRARTREEAEEDERAVRLKALEESLKKEEIDQATYDRLRGEIAGGDLSSTHLVKGLDFKLLERVRKGEDVFGGKEGTEDGAADGEKEEDGPDDDGDDVLDELEASEFKTVEREKVQKKGQFAPLALNPGQKRSRNQLLAEMKAMRAAAKAKAEESSLGSKFKKIGAKQTPGTRIERDSKGREVMIIIDEDGHERRKVRKLDPKAAEEQKREEAALMSSTVLGMEVPEFYKKQQEAEKAAQEEEDDKEVNIFDDAGSDYDPLADLEGDDASSSDEEGAVREDVSSAKPPPTSTDMPPPPLPASKTATAPRNYFQDSKTGLTSQEAYKSKTLAVDDPAFLAALKKAKSITAAEKTEEEQKAADREARLRQKLLDSQRDDDDLDLGFGSSRAEDEADLAEDPKIKLSEWRGDGGGDDDDDEEEGKGGGGGGKGKRKRGGGKKRKGDKNSFADVMKVIERNKAEGGQKG